MNEICKINPIEIGEGRNPRKLIRYVIKDEREKLIEALKEKYYDPEYVGQDGKTALIFAVECKNTQCISILLNGGCDPNSSTASISPVARALQMGYYRAVMILIRAGCNLYYDVDNKLTNLLHDLCKKPIWSSDAKEVFDVLVERCDINQPDDINGATPLHNAAVFNQQSTIELLLERGARLDALDAYGRTPLHCVMYFNPNLNIVRQLLLAGCKINLSQEQQKFDRIVREHIADQLAVVDGKGRTPLHIVLLGNMSEMHMEIVRYLVKSGSKPNVPDNEGITPLKLISRKVKNAQIHCATRPRALNCARMLFRAQAKLEADHKVVLLSQRFPWEPASP